MMMIMKRKYVWKYSMRVIGVAKINWSNCWTTATMAKKINLKKIVILKPIDDWLLHAVWRSSKRQRTSRWCMAPNQSQAWVKHAMKALHCLDARTAAANKAINFQGSIKSQRASIYFQLLFSFRYSCFGKVSAALQALMNHQFRELSSRGGSMSAADGYRFECQCLPRTCISVVAATQSWTTTV